MILNKCTRILLSVAAGGLLLVGLFLLLSESSQPARANSVDLFVTPDGTGDCSQSKPCGLLTALDQAGSGNDIYLAAGVYTGTGGAVITLTKSIDLYGGWDGTTTIPPARDPALHPTTLDGENARRVIYISGSISSVIDGFTITRGHGPYSGGGIYATNASLVLQDNQVINNYANGDGGGIFINRGSAKITGNQVRDNSATWAGGLRIINDANVKIVGNEIFSNTASNSGGGIDLDCCGGSTPFVAQNLIAYNQGASRGGGVLIQYTNARLENNILVGNQAVKGAGLSLDATASLPVSMTLIHNTLAGRTVGDEAIWAGPYVSATLYNNILAFHSTGITITVPASTTFLASHNLFWNGSDPFTGTNAVLDDPLLDAAYHLFESSPAIDAGTQTSVTTDIDSQSRPIGLLPDIGADERALKVYLPLVMRN